MNILIVEARYHPDVAEALTDGATAALEKGGARFERMSVPGVLEIPAAIAIAVRSPRPFDGYVALGAVTGSASIANIFYTETMRGLPSISPCRTISAATPRAPVWRWSPSANVWASRE